MAPPGHQKCWILTRSQGYQPGGTLSLGQVLDDAYEPASALMAEGPIPLPPSLVRDKTTETDVDTTSDDWLFASFKAWVRTNGLPFVAGAQGGFRKQGQAARALQMDALESDMVLPSPDYVKRVLGSDPVRSEMRWSKLRRSIFMVTGVRIAKGAALVDVAQTQGGWWLAAEGGGSAQNAPVEGRIAVGPGKGTSSVHAARRIDDFVYAYRLHEITYTLGRVSCKPIQSGETAAAGKEAPAARGGGEEEIEGEPEVTGMLELFEGFGEDDPELFE